MYVKESVVVKVRRARLADLAEIQGLQARSLRELSVGYYNKQQIESLVVTQAIRRSYFEPAESSAIYVAIGRTRSLVSAVSAEEEKIVGVASLVPNEPTISALFVHPDFARQGIASTLLNQLELDARGRGYSSLSVTSSLVAIPCYEAAGYQIIFRYKILSQQQLIRCAFMEKSLKRQAMHKPQKQIASPFDWINWLFEQWQ